MLKIGDRVNALIYNGIEIVGTVETIEGHIIGVCTDGGNLHHTVSVMCTLIT